MLELQGCKSGRAEVVALPVSGDKSSQGENWLLGWRRSFTHCIVALSFSLPSTLERSAKRRLERQVRLSFRAPSTAGDVFMLMPVSISEIRAMFFVEGHAHHMLKKSTKMRSSISHADTGLLS